MKKLIFCLALICISGSLLAQTDSTVTAPYLRFPTPPPFKLQLIDSDKSYTKDDLPKKKPVMIMLFSPDCEHCKHETEAIIQQIDEFKQVQIVMVSMLPIERIKEFYELYDLGRFKNIVVGKDATYLLPGFYNVRNLPFLAFYNKKKELISVFEGNMGIPKILAELAK